MTAARSAAVLGCCLWGALAGWAAAMFAAQPELWSGSTPGFSLLLYGAAASFGSGYLVGSTTRGKPPSRFDPRVAGCTAVLALGVKVLAPTLAAWTAVLIAGAAFGIVAGVIRTR